jgi:hypothetical protein
MIQHADEHGVAIRVAGFSEGAQGCARAVEGLDLRGELRWSIGLNERSDAGLRMAEAHRKGSVATVVTIGGPDQGIRGRHARPGPAAGRRRAAYGHDTVASAKIYGNRILIRRCCVKV